MNPLRFCWLLAIAFSAILAAFFRGLCGHSTSHHAPTTVPL
jgi:hypothetical protein